MIKREQFEQYLRLKLLEEDETKEVIRFLWDTVNSISIDFLREVDGKVDIQKILYDAAPWDWSESIEEHMLRCYPDLKEFWKKML